jgi:hypothetical protein
MEAAVPIPRASMPSGSEVVMNDEFAIANHESCACPRVDGHIESADRGVLVLQIKSRDEWMDPELILNCDRLDENSQFYSLSCGLIGQKLEGRSVDDRDISNNNSHRSCNIRPLH